MSLSSFVTSSNFLISVLLWLCLHIESPPPQALPGRPLSTSYSSASFLLLPSPLRPGASCLNNSLWSRGYGSYCTMNNPHDYLITSPPSRPVDPNNNDSWVMLNQSGFVKLSNEKILQKLDTRISCELSVASEIRARHTPFHRKSDKGTLFLTNKRVCLDLGYEIFLGKVLTYSSGCLFACKTNSGAQV